MEGKPWQIAGNPDLGDLTGPDQQPVDFAVWKAADGTWQLWSCIRDTKEPGRTRLFYRWESPHLTSANWTPRGIAMQADPSKGETPGGLQAPYVLPARNRFLMFYGDWKSICMAESQDGKSFKRIVHNGRAGMFSEGDLSNTRDVMVINIEGVWHCYYTAIIDRKGAVFLRTSRNLKTWSASRRVAFGGSAGDGPGSAESPFVYQAPDGSFYLFRTQVYGRNARTSVYHSTDPTNFGINDDRCLVGTLPIAAPEIVEDRGQLFIAYLLPDLNGIQISRLTFE